MSGVIIKFYIGAYLCTKHILHLSMYFLPFMLYRPLILDAPDQLPLVVSPKGPKERRGHY